jgi:hypothetical protein
MIDQNNKMHRLTRKELHVVIIFHPRTGHCRLQHHLHHKFGIGESDWCPCNTEPMTADHALTRYPKLATLRDEI